MTCNEPATAENSVATVKYVSFYGHLNTEVDQNLVPVGICCLLYHFSHLSPRVSLFSPLFVPFVSFLLECFLFICREV